MKRTLSWMIDDTLVRYAHNVLIEDQSVSWTGIDIEKKIQVIQKHLEVTTLENSLVGVCFPNLAFQGLAILAVLKSKRIPVILSYTDLMQKSQKWIDRLHLDLLISTEDLNQKAISRFQVLSMDLNGEVVHAPFLKEFSAHIMIGNFAPRGTALVLYTSGSTGEPKGVCVPEEGIKETCRYLIKYFELNEKTVTPIVLPVCHSMALNTQFLPTFFAGGKSTFFNSRLGMNKLYRYITSVDGTFVSLISEVLRVCWEEKTIKDLLPNNNVKHVQLAGGTIQEKHLKMASELFPMATIHKGYGLTEGIRVTMIDQTDPEFLTNNVGSPLPFQEIEVRNSQNEALPPNEVGEIFVKGPNVMMGVLGSKKTPFDERGFLATGDLGYLNKKNQLCIYGRKDSVFKINGLKVSGIEIEKIALNVSALIREAKCLSIEDEKRDRNKVVLFLEIPLERHEQFFQSYFESFHTALWNEFKTLNYFPKDIILTPRFPKTSNGKLSLKGLRDLWKDENKDRIELPVKGSFHFYKTSEQFVMENYSDEPMQIRL